LPDNVPANEFLNLEGEKISTSRNWAVWLHEYLEEFPGKQDVLRYVLTANAPETKDNDFTWKDYQTRNNSELVAIYGNFVNRAVVLTQKFFQGIVPERGELHGYDQEILAALAEYPEKIASSIERYRFREALSIVMDLARMGNKYLADTEPWKEIKVDEARTKTILNIALNIAANLAIVSEPFLPHTAKKLFDLFNIENVKWNQAGDGELIHANRSLGEMGLLFEKIEDETVERQVQKLLNAKKMNDAANTPVAPMKELITYDDFAKLDMRVVTILEAEKMPKSKKLLKLKVDVGLGHRTVLSGVAEHFEPEFLVGKQVTMLINLAPRKMMGIDSEGMILMAEDKDGKLKLLQPHEGTASGSTIS
jgi:methionyl-tRNA synthetase